jgi:hypothetical protein
MKTKKTLLLAFALMLIVSLKAQNREDEYGNSGDEIVTLVGNSHHVGGYGAFSVKYMSLDDRDGIMFGGRAGAVIGHGFSFGITGTGFLTQPVYDDIVGDDAMVTGGYGGLYIEPILLPRFPVHIALPMTFGGGGIGYSVNHYDRSNGDDWDNDYTDRRGFLIFEPGIEVEFNVMRHFRFAVGGSYKFTSNIDLRYDDGNGSRIISYDALNGATIGVTLKFGSF